MLAFTILLVVCSVVGSSATKVHGASTRRIAQAAGGTIRQVPLLSRSSMSQYGVVGPSRYLRTSRRSIPHSKYSSGVGTYATNMYNNDITGVLNAQYLSMPTSGSMTYTIPTSYDASLSSPVVTGSAAYTMPTAYQTGYSTPIVTGTYTMPTAYPTRFSSPVITGAYTAPASYQTSFSSPMVTSPGAYVVPNTYTAGSTYDINLGSQGTTYNTGGSIQLLNAPFHSSGGYRTMVPHAKQVGVVGSY